METILISIIFFAPLAFGAVEPWAQGLLECGAFLALGLCFWTRRSADTVLSKTLLPAVLLLLLLGCLQWLRPFDPGNPGLSGPFTVSRYDTRNILLLWGAFAALLWCVPRTARTPAALRRFQWAFFGIGAVVAAVGILQMLDHPRLIYGFRPVSQELFFKPFGPFYNRDDAASLMAMSALIGFGIFFSRFYAPAEAGSVGEVADFLSTQGLIGLALAIIVAGIVASGSRAGFCLLVAGFCSGIFLSTFDWRHRGRAVAVRGFILCSAVAVTMIFAKTNPRMMAMFRNLSGRGIDASISDRLSLYRSGADMIADAPVFGWGIGSFARAFPRYQDKARFPNNRIEHLHSDWLELAAETGGVGFGILGLGVASFLFAAFRSWHSCERKDLREFAGWGLCAAGIFILHCLVDFPFHVPANAMMFLMLLGCLGAPVYADPAAQKKVDPPSGASMIPAGLCLGAWSFAAISLGPLPASWLMHQSYRVPAADRPRLIEEALRWDPRPAYYFQAASACLGLAQTGGASDERWRSRAWDYAEAALRQDRWNPEFRRLRAGLLDRAGRTSDEKYVLEYRP